MALGERRQPISTTPDPWAAFPEKPLRLFCIETLRDVAQIYEAERGSGQKTAFTKNCDTPVWIKPPFPSRLGHYQKDPLRFTPDSKLMLKPANSSGCCFH